MGRHNEQHRAGGWTDVQLSAARREFEHAEGRKPGVICSIKLASPNSLAIRVI